MVRAEKIEHVKLTVSDISVAKEFYRDVMGLVEIEETNDTLFLGCGRDTNFDVGLTAGEPGLDHVAVRVGSDDLLAAYATKLDDLGMEPERTGGDEPGQTGGLRVRLPSGVAIELVTVADDAYPHSDDVAYPSRVDVAPLDLDHVNLRTPAIEDDVECLQTLGFGLTEVIGTPEKWYNAFVRCKEKHHDIALSGRSVDGSQRRARLHHVAWTYSDLDHMKRLIDRLTQAGIDLERPPGRHYAGDNLFAYFWSPGGNRIELTAEMASIYSEETEYLEPNSNAGTGWGTDAPESFDRVSGLVDGED